MGSQVLQRIAKQVRNSENMLVMAEKMGVIANQTNGYRYNQENLDEAWRTLMMAQHHDSWIVPYNRLFRQQTWAEFIQKWTAATDSICQDIILGAAKSFSSGIVTGQGAFLRVYNTLGVPRREIISASLPEGSSGLSMVVTNAKGKKIDNYITTGGDGKPALMFEADVPAFGYATYYVKPSNKTAKKNVNKNGNNSNEFILENSMYRIAINPLKGGIISSLIAKKEGNKEFADKGSRYSIGELQGFFYDEGKFRSSTETSAKITLVTDNSLEKTVRIEGQIASHPFTQIITIKEGQRKIEYGLTISWNENVGIGEYRQTDAHRSNTRGFYDDRFKLNVLFPVKLESPALYKNAPFDVCRSELENTFFNTWDNIKHNIILNWVDLSEGSNKNGFAVLSDHTTSYSYGKDFPLGLTVQFSGNGLWGRDYLINGPTNMKFAIIPHSNAWDASDINNESLRWNEPLVSSFLQHAKLENVSLIDIDKTGYELSTAYLSGNDIIVRFFNADGGNSLQNIKIGMPLSKAEEIDLNGKTIAALNTVKTNSGMELKLEMPRFGLRTLKLTK